jgi:acylphosphatase
MIGYHDEARTLEIWSMIHNVHAIIKGKVQGVGYRNWAYSQAKLLKLNGWVRNLPSGEVELVAEGPESTLHSFVSFLKTGPTMARVTGVEASWSSQNSPRYSDFQIKR